MGAFLVMFVHQNIFMSKLQFIVLNNLREAFCMLEKSSFPMKKDILQKDIYRLV